MNTKEEKTVEQKIQEWKEKYGDVYRVDVDGHMMPCSWAYRHSWRKSSR